MIKEAYCSFEVSKLLKEKGFNERSYCYYYLNGEIRQAIADAPWNNGVMEPILICAPTHQMAMAWLREEKNIFRVEFYSKA